MSRRDSHYTHSLKDVFAKMPMFGDMADKVDPRELVKVEAMIGSMTADETADLLRTTRKAVYAMAERGQLPGVTRISRRLLVRREALLDWLDQKRTRSLEE